MFGVVRLSVHLLKATNILADVNTIMCFKNASRVCVAFCSSLCKVRVGGCITRLSAAEDSAREQGHASPRRSFSLPLRVAL